MILPLQDPQNELFIPSSAAVFSFARVTAAVGKGAERIVVSTCLLPDGQQRYTWADRNLTQEALFTRLEASFVRFGGVPRYIAVRSVRPFGHPAPDDVNPWLRPFRRFCSHYGSQPWRIFGPDQQDGVFQEVGEWLRSHPLSCFEEVQHELQRLHVTTPHPPSDLLPLPSRPFVRNKETFRKVAADGFVSFAGDHYSVPAAYAGQFVWVRRNDNHIQVCLQDGRHLATHEPGDGRGTIRLDPQHFEATRLQARHALCRLTLRFLSVFPHHQEFLERLVAQRKLGAPASLRAILGLVRTTDATAMEQAFAACLHYNNFSQRFLTGIIERLEEGDDRSLCDDQPAYIEGQLF
ncbi:MAG: Mu transposase domain-containing protein [Acidobacteriaceae bacterium]